MLKNIKVKNYKAFRQETNVELRPITVLIGRNSSGKSSLCKLIDAVGVALRDDTVGFLPIQTEHNNRLGDMHDDLFYQRVTNDLQIGLTFDNNKQIEASFLMQDGVFCPNRYFASHGDIKTEKNFVNKEESLQANFKGLYFPEVCETAGISHGDLQYSVDYIGPIRCRAKRRLERVDVKRDKYVGDDGSKAYEMLLYSYLTDAKLLYEVSAWCLNNMDGQQLSIAEQAPGSGVFNLYVERNGARVNIADVGEGLAQVLPIVVQSFVRNADITIIEQPSLHLNSAAHALVATRLAESSVALGKKYIIETHSDTFLSGIRKMVAERRLNREDVVIYCLHHDGTSATLEKIEIDDNFEYTSWPEGMFEDNYKLQNEISRLIG